MKTKQTLLKKEIHLVGGAVTNPAAQSYLKTYQVLESFTHFYESHSHVYLIGKDICAVMAKHFPFFAFKTRDTKKTRHGIGDGAFSTLLNTMRKNHRAVKYLSIAGEYTQNVGAPKFTAAVVKGPMAHIIDEVMCVNTPQPVSGFSDLFN